MKNKPLLTAVALMGAGVIAGVVLVSAFGSGSMASVFAADKELGAKQTPIQLDEKTQLLNNASIAVSKAVTPTVVSINVETERKTKSPQFQIPEEFAPFFRSPDGDEAPETQRGEAAGSGVFITTDGYIITNNHVVEDAKDGGIRVITSDRHEYDARLIGRDPLTDLAVIKVEGSSFTPAYIANSDDVQVGEWVMAVGNPLGLHSTITAGIISAIGRGQLGLSASQYGVENFLQTDAAINPGNSGGGLFDLQGRLVGINSAIATRTGYYQGYGFAIPSNLMKAVAQDIIEDGKVDRGYIGVQIKTIDETDAKAAGLDRVAGVMVNDVVKGSAAQAAGIETGDIITKVDGVTVNSSNELQSRVVLHRAGQTVKLDIWRNGKMFAKSVTLRPRDEDKTVTSSARPGLNKDEEKAQPMNFDKLGFSVEPLDNKTREDLDVREGVVVNKVSPYSQAARRGIRVGDVITAADLDKKAITSPGALKSILDGKEAGKGLVLYVKGKEGARIVTLEIPRQNG